MFSWDKLRSVTPAGPFSDTALTVHIYLLYHKKKTTELENKKKLLHSTFKQCKKVCTAAEAED